MRNHNRDSDSRLANFGLSQSTAPTPFLPSPLEKSEILHDKRIVTARMVAGMVLGLMACPIQPDFKSVKLDAGTYLSFQAFIRGQFALMGGDDGRYIGDMPEQRARLFDWHSSRGGRFPKFARSLY
jgi:hypothetical protein